MTTYKYAAELRAMADRAEVSETPWDVLEWRLTNNEHFPWKALGGIPNLTSRIYRVKPRTITVNGVEVPEPLREAPAEGSLFWMVSLLDAEPSVVQWSTSRTYMRCLERGLLHATQKNAQAHIDALLLPSRKPQ